MPSILDYDRILAKHYLAELRGEITADERARRVTEDIAELEAREELRMVLLMLIPLGAALLALIVLGL